jgi:type II secretory pathway pseudopilin PulG
MSNIKFQMSNKGFTLIEAVVATSVFAFVVTSILGVYISTIQLDRKTRAQRAVAQNARFITEFLAKEVRNGSINYASYPGGTVAGTGDLYLQNQANEIEHLFLNGTNLVLNKNGANTNMNSSAVKVTNLKYYIQPIGDPYTADKTYNEQPRVTFVLELTSNYGTQANDIVKINLQNTVAVRNYPSR